MPLRTILAITAALLPLLGQPASTQKNPAQEQSPMTRDPALNPSAGPDAGPITGPSPAANQQGERNPAAATASGCGTTDDKLAQTPPMGTPCPGPYPTPGAPANK